MQERRVATALVDISCFAVVYYFVMVSDNNGFGCSLLSSQRLLSTFILVVVCSSKQIRLHVRIIGFWKRRGSNGVLPNPHPNPQPPKKREKSTTKQGGCNQINVYSTGYLYWYPYVVFETSCYLDLTYFPLDTQTCSVIVFGFTRVMVSILPSVITKQDCINLCPTAFGTWFLTIP